MEIEFIKLNIWAHAVALTPTDFQIILYNRYDSQKLCKVWLGQVCLVVSFYSAGGS